MPATTITRAPLLQGSILAEEIALETQAVRDGVARYRDLAQKAIVRGEGASLKPAERRLLYWLHPLVLNIRKERRAVRKGEPGVGRGIYGPMILRIKPPRLAVLALHEVIGQCMGDPAGVPFVKLAYSIGRAASAEIGLDEMRQEKPTELRDLINTIKRPGPSHYNRWANKTLDEPVWNRRVCVHLGGYLIWEVINVSDAGVSEEFRLAFHHERRRQGRKTIAFVRMDQVVFDEIEKDHEFRERMRPRYLPMIVPPYPWQEDESGQITQGGYVRIRTPFISKPTSTQKAALSLADLSEVYECLDAVVATGWRVQQDNYGAARNVWETGGGELGIPRTEDQPKPPKPDDFETNPDTKKAWKRSAAKVHRENIRAKGDRVETHRMFDMAGMLSRRESFWFPHQLDFRGRCYPIPQHLNHHGNDVRRGALEFARGVPIDDRGMYWLRVHAAGCFGVDKVSFNDREQWTLAHAKDIRRAAQDPESGWWKTAKNPWRFRHACLALNNTDTAAHIPIDLDGTCNGLQHYTALGRDQAGAALVNMLPSNTPADVYSQVATNVRAIVSEEASAGNAMAGLIARLIDRDLVKQTTMTTVYGVTMVGAREQIRARLKEAGLKDRELFDASMYLSKVVLRGIGQSVAAAELIMEWLRECAKIISFGLGEPITWITKLGFPVVQPYRRYRTTQIHTILQRVTVAVPDDSVPVMVKRQCDGVAPNFVHSLDSTHMFLTARACHRGGIDFAAVHDCYRFHAANVDRGAEILREEFINLHERPILSDLLEYWTRKHPKAKFPDPPAPGVYDLSLVRSAPYFFN